MTTKPVVGSLKTGGIAAFFGICGAVVFIGMLLVGIPFWFAWLPLLIALVGLPLGIRRLAARPDGDRIAFRAFILALVLSPIGFVFCLSVMFATPTILGTFSHLLHGENVVLKARSPDGRYEAYVVDQPSIDGPNQDLYVRRGDGRRYLFIAHLPEDIDSIQKIHWSPRSDIVVFETSYALIATRMPGYITVQIPFVEWYRERPDGGHMGPHGDAAGVTMVQFPQPGTFIFRAKDDREPTLVDMNNLQPRPEVQREPSMTETTATTAGSPISAADDDQ